MKEIFKKAIFIGAAALCLTPFIDPPVALLIGLLTALSIGNPYMHHNNRITGWLLKASIVGLGFGINLRHAVAAGTEGLLYILVSIAAAIIMGLFIGRALKVGRKTSFLISSGTAICGGSAIAAIAPIVGADEKEISIALGTIFLLNSAALFLFPAAGHLLGMTQHQFGIWSAIAIHDTSSVVGAASKFGEEAMRVATTVKLERALWIIPLSFLTVLMVKGDRKKIRMPYFIGLYIITMCLSTYIPQFNQSTVSLQPHHEGD